MEIVNFYNGLKDRIKNELEVYLITIIKDNNEGKTLLGEKVYITSKEIVPANKELYTFWQGILAKVDIKDVITTIKVVEEYEIFIQRLEDKPKLIICGGGHIAVPLCSIGKLLGFEIIVIDNRKEFANVNRFSNADKVICMDFFEALQLLKNITNSYCVIVTRGHKDDKTVLKAAINNNYRYIGMIGSKSKVAYVKSELKIEGFAEEILNKIYSPIGISIGAKTPQEIAVSIAAEIIMVKSRITLPTINEEIIDAILLNDNSKVIVTIIEKHGSAPREVGAQMLVLEDNKQIGTIGGGAIENEAIQRAMICLEDKINYVGEYDLSNSQASELGMVCGGVIKILFEFIQ